MRVLRASRWKARVVCRGNGEEEGCGAYLEVVVSDLFNQCIKASELDLVETEKVCFECPICETVTPLDPRHVLSGKIATENLPCKQ